MLAHCPPCIIIIIIIMPWPSLVTLKRKCNSWNFWAIVMWVIFSLQLRDVHKDIYWSLSWGPTNTKLSEYSRNTVFVQINLQSDLFNYYLDSFSFSRQRGPRRKEALESLGLNSHPDCWLRSLSVLTSLHFSFFCHHTSQDDYVDYMTEYMQST